MQLRRQLMEVALRPGAECPPVVQIARDRSLPSQLSAPVFREGRHQAGDVLGDLAIVDMSPALRAGSSLGGAITRAIGACPSTSCTCAHCADRLSMWLLWAISPSVTRPSGRSTISPAAALTDHEHQPRPQSPPAASRGV